MKMHSLKTKAIDSAAENRALGAPELSTNNDGASLHLEGEHMKAMGVDEGLPHGHPVTIEATGTVHRSESGPEGGRMHVKLHKMGMEYDEPKDKKERSLKDDLKKSMNDSESKEAGKQFEKLTKGTVKADDTGNK